MIRPARQPQLPTHAVPSDSPDEASVGAIYPALAQLLGPSSFEELCAAAIARSASAGTPPGALIHSVLVHREARTDDRLPSRLAADIAALEWAIHRVAMRAPHQGHDGLATPRDLQAEESPDSAPRGGWRGASLQPAAAFDIVQVAFRLETWVRHAHHGRRPRGLPDRGEQHIVVHAPPFSAPIPGTPTAVEPGHATEDPLQPLRPHGVAPPTASWFALSPGLGKLLAQLALGMPVGVALGDAVKQGWVTDEAAARAQLDAWLREGLFARVVSAEQAPTPHTSAH